MVEVQTSSASEIYYLHVGVGHWIGTFRFRVTDWRKLFNAHVGTTNLFLVLCMATCLGIFRKGRIVSTLEQITPIDDKTVVRNQVDITLLGIPLYTLREHYILDPDGWHVWVKSQERFGPIPFLFNRKKEHPAEILDNGLRSIYFIPLLGDQWQAHYLVQEDHDHIDGHLTCAWAEGFEVIHRAR